MCMAVMVALGLSVEVFIKWKSECSKEEAVTLSVWVLPSYKWSLSDGVVVGWFLYFG